VRSHKVEAMGGKGDASSRGMHGQGSMKDYGKHSAGYFDTKN
jgi:hypothetical protein